MVERSYENRFENQSCGRHFISVETVLGDSDERDEVNKEFEDEIEEVEGNGVGEKESDCELNSMNLHWVKWIIRNRNPVETNIEFVVDESCGRKEEI